MLVAVPTFHGRVSPTFDFCHRVTFWQVEGMAFQKLANKKCRPTDPFEKAVRLQAMGTEMLLCGAIGTVLKIHLEAMGIQVLSGIAGEVREVLTAFTTGALHEPRFRIPGAPGNPPIPGGA
ncbi:NifB/NifX family molybdenum-iron cluster-binding protein [Mesoterricola silvestris]|uniref:Dinitrogenase iron-molybdenum cofactor biosynthesis domain-containing protein n=1 Tax=Mesoterricola silvestris TaxID=2927979 RepID=A0AA48H863_9BACT|nr:NifB/NifX family molybdenum-iron cluster-binding protein [Mesoterricola silvestris]BDU73563.1 hypothetical protein METEAL_27370 [Mesoterricola silvestris]